VDTNVKDPGKQIPDITSRQTGRPQRYPWDAWEDGTAREIIRGVHFKIPAPNMAAVIRSRANRKGRRATALVFGSAVRFQFDPPIAEKKAA
jgi:hypothetical protein